ncbi:MAG: translation initiation factor Sui1 [Magnetococcus sp. DMHC-6]
MLKDKYLYSTEHGRLCSTCQHLLTDCICGQKRLVSSTDGVVRIRKESKGRQGKEVTLIQGVTLDPISLRQLGKNLKLMCGSGGTIKEGIIELQGDHVERVMAFLLKQGFVVKRSGG